MNLSNGNLKTYTPSQQSQNINVTKYTLTETLLILREVTKYHYHGEWRDRFQWQQSIVQQLEGACK